MRILLFLSLVACISFIHAKEMTPLGHYTQAYTAFSKQDSTQNRVTLAAASNDMGQTQQAIVLLQPLLEKDPWNLQALKVTAYAYFLQNRLPESGDYLAKIVEHYPSSKEASWAKSLVKQMKVSTIDAYYATSITTGVNSNPLELTSDKTVLNNYLNTLSNPNFSVLSLTDNTMKFYTQIDASAQYIHDLGDRGDFFQLYGISFTTKQFIDASLPSYTALYGTYGLGYASFLGQFTLPLSLGYYKSGYSYGILTNNQDFRLVRVAPTYAYRFQSGDIFTMSLEHFEIQSDTFVDVYRSDLNITETYPVNQDTNQLYLEYTGRINAQDIMRIKLFVASYQSQNYTGYSPYAGFQQGGIQLSYNYSFSSTLRFIGELSLYTNQFESPTDLNVSIPVDYDRKEDVNNLMRKDKVAQYSVEIQYTHSKTLISALTLKAQFTQTDFEPVDKTIFDIAYTLYWLP